MDPSCGSDGLTSSARCLWELVLLAAFALTPSLLKNRSQAFGAQDVLRSGASGPSFHSTQTITQVSTRAVSNLNSRSPIHIPSLGGKCYPFPMIIVNMRAHTIPKGRNSFSRGVPSGPSDRKRMPQIKVKSQGRSAVSYKTDARYAGSPISLVVFSTQIVSRVLRVQNQMLQGTERGSRFEGRRSSRGPPSEKSAWER